MDQARLIELFLKDYVVNYCQPRKLLCFISGSFQLLFMNIKENHKEMSFEIYEKINSFTTVQLGESVTFGMFSQNKYQQYVRVMILLSIA